MKYCYECSAKLITKECFNHGVFVGRYNGIRAGCRSEDKCRILGDDNTEFGRGSGNFA